MLDMLLLSVSCCPLTDVYGEVSMPVLLWGGSAESGDDGDELLAIAQTMMQVLFLPQFQPILLPKYTVELLAILVFGEVKSGVRVATLAEFHRLRELMLRTLPLRLTMSSLRAALGQSAGRSAVVASFKQQCGLLLSHLSMEDGGLMTSIEMLLGAVDEGNTQARMQVVTLVRECGITNVKHHHINMLLTLIPRFVNVQATWLQRSTSSRCACKSEGCCRRPTETANCSVRWEFSSQTEWLQTTATFLT